MSDLAPIIGGIAKTLGGSMSASVDAKNGKEQKPVDSTMKEGEGKGIDLQSILSKIGMGGTPAAGGAPMAGASAAGTPEAGIASTAAAGGTEAALPALLALASDESLKTNITPSWKDEARGYVAQMRGK